MDEIENVEINNSSAEVPQLDIPVGDFAAKMYSILLPQFDSQVNSLSRKGLLRVINSLVKIPLVDYTPVMSELEKNVYAVSDRLLQAKFVMISEVLTEEFTKTEGVENGKV